jgi:hypothetical protein
MEVFKLRQLQYSLPWGHYLVSPLLQNLLLEPLEDGDMVRSIEETELTEVELKGDEFDPLQTGRLGIGLDIDMNFVLKRASVSSMDEVIQIGSFEWDIHMRIDLSQELHNELVFDRTGRLFDRIESLFPTELQVWRMKKEQKAESVQEIEANLDRNRYFLAD